MADWLLGNSRRQPHGPVLEGQPRGNPGLGIAHRLIKYCHDTWGRPIFDLAEVLDLQTLATGKYRSANPLPVLSPAV